MSISVDASKCNGCTLCVKSCGTNAIEVKDKLATITIENCTMCGACVSACRFKAISIDIEKQPQEDLDKYKGVWVFGEQREGKQRTATHEKSVAHCSIRAPFSSQTANGDAVIAAAPYCPFLFTA